MRVLESRYGVALFLALVLETVGVVPVIAQEPGLDKLGVSRGVCMLVGNAGGRAAEIAKATELTIYVQSGDAADVQAWRGLLDAAGLLGKRVWVQQGDIKSLHLADDLADVVIADPATPRAEIERVLRPGGKGFVGDKVVTKAFRRGTDEWSHPYHGPDNNPQSDDTVLKRPYLTHFMAEPWYCPLPMQSVISGGRIFKVFGDRSSARPQEPLINKLLAMSAFNGAVLWQRDLSPGFMIHRNTMIATPDVLYLGDDVSCKVIDAATGKVRDEITVPADKTDGQTWKWMGLEDGVLYAIVGEKEGSDQPLKTDRIRGAGWPWWNINKYKFGFGKNFFAIDPATKKVLWHHREEEAIDSRGVALRKGRLYITCEGKFVACLDAKTGTPLWRNKDADLLEALGDTKAAQHWLLGFASTAFLKVSDDALYFAGPNRPLLVAASAKDGKLMWKRDCSVKVEGNTPTEGGNVLLVLRSDGLYALGQGRINGDSSSFKLDPKTGEVLATFQSRDRCTRATGCFDSIFTRGGKGGSTAVFDVTSQQPKMGTISPMRPACQDGVVTAHGYMFWGPWMCRCDMTQLGVISLGTGGTIDYLAAAKDDERLETTSAAVSGQFPKDVAWPAYRRDNSRTVVTDLTTPDKVEVDWTYQSKSKELPTAPIAVGGMFVTGSRDGAIRALDAKTGDVRWTTYTGGPLLYPPSFADQRFYAGSGDGHVYCLDAASGKVLWRFQAAPTPRVIPIYGTLTSTWPVNTGALVHEGTVYAAAGIANFDGTHVFALDAKTGKIRWQKHSSSYQGDDLPMGGVSVQGPMILHKNAVHMPSGNTPPIATYALADGAYTPTNTARGKDLFIRNGQLAAAGFPLYWRPQDDHFLSTMELESPHGVLKVGIPANDPTAPNQLARLGDDQKPLWSNPKLFQEVAAVAFTKNAILMTGLNRLGRDKTEIAASLVALRPADGQVIWQVPLPAVPTAWGLALDGDGRIAVTMMDGRTMAFRPSR